MRHPLPGCYELALRSDLVQLFPINMEDENVKKYTLKRVITALFTLLAILLVLFVLMQLMPGSPFNDEKLNDSQRAALYAKYGLDQPVVVQFFRYVGNMLRGVLELAIIFLKIHQSRS